MPVVKSLFQITGSLGNLSFYLRKDSEKFLVRTKGGPTKEQIKNDPNFERTRENMSEFGGRAAASKQIMNAVRELKLLADYNIAASLQPLLAAIQKFDQESKRGQRHIFLSRQAQWLADLEFNKKNPINSIVRNPPVFTIDRAAANATIEIPELLPGLNLAMIYLDVPN